MVTGSLKTPCWNWRLRMTSGPCGKFGDRLFTATAVRARRKNAGIAGPTSNFFNAAMATVAKKSGTELSARPTSTDYFDNTSQAVSLSHKTNTTTNTKTLLDNSPLCPTI